MNTRYAWIIGGGFGLVLGYLFGHQRGDIWLGGALVAVYTIAGYGFLAFPKYRTRWSGAHSRFWYSVVGVLPIIVLLIITPNSPLLSEANGPPVILLLGGLWLGGVYAGVSLEHKSGDGPEN